MEERNVLETSGQFRTLIGRSNHYQPTHLQLGMPRQKASRHQTTHAVRHNVKFSRTESRQFPGEGIRIFLKGLLRTPVSEIENPGTTLLEGLLKCPHGMRRAMHPVEKKDGPD
jgi:hypothetical protein